jgi:hypothetical protein
MHKIVSENFLYGKVRMYPVKLQTDGRGQLTPPFSRNFDSALDSENPMLESPSGLWSVIYASGQ